MLLKNLRVPFPDVIVFDVNHELRDDDPNRGGLVCSCIMTSLSYKTQNVDMHQEAN